MWSQLCTCVTAIKHYFSGLIRLSIQKRSMTWLNLQKCVFFLIPDVLREKILLSLFIFFSPLKHFNFHFCKCYHIQRLQQTVFHLQSVSDLFLSSLHRFVLMKSLWMNSCFSSAFIPSVYDNNDLILFSETNSNSFESLFLRFLKDMQ